MRHTEWDIKSFYFIRKALDGNDDDDDDNLERVTKSKCIYTHTSSLSINLFFLQLFKLQVNVT